ncbi:MAG: C-GCAxxG-C-C family protein [Clostridiaceae bacterium]|nr:C-GCAxxG-C-C family protein [Clostridiaceae bacterium]
MESRKEMAQKLFKEGYNCSQSVFAAYADRYGIDRETALKISASFGGGMGRMREVCGAVSGMFLVAGLETGSTDGKDAAGKKYNYQIVQDLAEEYRKQNGSIICRELLGLVPMSGRAPESPADAGAQNTAAPHTAEPAGQSAEGETGLKAAEFKDTTPEARTKEYYKKRPCMKLVGQACEILEQILYGGQIQED